MKLHKVINTGDGRLVYMSRLPIHGHMDEKNVPVHYYKQACRYVFTHQELMACDDFGHKEYLEQCEDIELLCFLQLNIPVHILKTSGDSNTVDVTEE